jgi:phosphatidylglycerophosphatase A
MALSQLPLWAYGAVVLIGFVAGVYLCDVAARRLAIKDPGMVVWDEFVGLWIALAWAPPGWLYVLLGLVLFRIFDILKPWPIGYLDRRVQGGLGIMLDDVVAGLFACLVLQAIALAAGTLL